MRILPFLPVAGVALWMGAITATMVQTPAVALTATPTCAEIADAWEARLIAEGFAVERRDDAESASACVGARIGGFTIDGPVDPAALSKLLMKKPRGVTGLSLTAGGETMATLVDGGAVPFARVLEKEKKH